MPHICNEMSSATHVQFTCRLSPTNSAKFQWGCGEKVIRPNLIPISAVCNTPRTPVRGFSDAQALFVPRCAVQFPRRTFLRPIKRNELVNIFFASRIVITAFIERGSFFLSALCFVSSLKLGLHPSASHGIAFAFIARQLHRGR